MTFALQQYDADAPRDSTRTSTRDLWRALLRRPTFVASAAIIACWLVVAVAWRWVGVDPFSHTGHTLAAPTTDHWFGTDRIGRDVLARVLAGAESAIVVGLLGAACASVFGTVLGLLAGYYRGWIDQMVMRVLDLFIALPAIIFLLVIVGAFGGTTWVIALSVGVLFAPGIARIIRAGVLVEMGKDYVASAQLQRERTVRILLGEILPNVAPQMLVQAMTSVAGAVFVAASLSFLGLAAEPPSPDWGLAINENRAYLQGAWWTVVFPALALASFVVAVNLIGDNLREVFHR